jgi:hypothetical protein
VPSCPISRCRSHSCKYNYPAVISISHNTTQKNHKRKENCHIVRISPPPNSTPSLFLQFSTLLGSLLTLTSPPLRPSLLRQLGMIRRISIIILIYVSVSAAWCCVDAAFTLLKARGWCFGSVFLGWVSCVVLRLIRVEGRGVRGTRGEKLETRGNGGEIGNERGLRRRRRRDKYPIHHYSISYHLS